MRKNNNVKQTSRANSLKQKRSALLKELLEAKDKNSELEKQNLDLKNQVKELKNYQEFMRRSNLEKVSDLERQNSELHKELERVCEKNPSFSKVKQLTENKFQKIKELKEQVHKSLNTLGETSTKKLKLHEIQIKSYFNDKFEKAKQQITQTERKNSTEELAKSPFKLAKQYKENFEKSESFIEKLLEENKILKTRIKELESDLETANLRSQQIPRKTSLDFNNFPRPKRSHSSAKNISDPLIRSLHQELRSSQIEARKLRAQLHSKNELELKQLIEEALQKTKLNLKDRQQVLDKVTSAAQLQGKNFPKLSVPSTKRTLQYSGSVSQRTEST